MRRMDKYRISVSRVISVVLFAHLGVDADSTYYRTDHS